MVVAPDHCDNYVPGSRVTAKRVSLRYSYARVFEREVSIRLPVALAVTC
jgi:hypothetical protein